MNGPTPDPHLIVLFGALGDLARRKLLPGLFHLDRAGLMPDDYRVIGTSRRGGTPEDFRDVAREAIGDGAAGADEPGRWSRRSRRPSAGSTARPGAWLGLAGRRGVGQNRSTRAGERQRANGEKVAQGPGRSCR